jgi:hypothetical protein
MDLIGTGNNYKSSGQNPAEKHKITNISISYGSEYTKNS